MSSVWLQFGVRLDDLDRELLWLRGAFPALELVGSVFLPTKKLIAQQKFRPWNGVALSDEYLSGPEAAERVTRQLLDLTSRATDVRPLVEAPGVRTAKDLAVVSRLFGEPAPPAKKRRLCRPRYLQDLLGLGLHVARALVRPLARVPRGRYLENRVFEDRETPSLLHRYLRDCSRIGIQGCAFIVPSSTPGKNFGGSGFRYCSSLRSSRSPGSTQIAPTEWKSGTLLGTTIDGSSSTGSAYKITRATS